MTIPLAKALKEWESRNNILSTDAKEIGLYGGLVVGGSRVFINKLDAALATLKSCEKLSLSTNQIDRMAPLTGMEKLRVLSLGRNAIRKLERLEDVAGTLEELWISYNGISSLDGLSACQKLRILYMSNNQIKDWTELDKLANLPELHEVLFVGNPIYEGVDRATARLLVLKRLPKLAKIDSEVVTELDREAAAKLQ